MPGPWGWGRPIEEPGSDAIYCCPGCEQDLVYSYTYFVFRGDGPAELDIGYLCPVCTPGTEPRVLTFPYRYSALQRLFRGTVPTIPWERNPSVDGPLGMTLEERWAFELEGIETAHDFLLKCQRW